MWSLLQAPARPLCSATAAPAALPAIIIVTVIVVAGAIVVIAYPPFSTIAIANAIAIAAHSGHIFGSIMAMALLFLGGGQ
jgi:hypothetical protein